MGKRKLWNWWTAGKHERLHILTAFFFPLLYALGFTGLSANLPLREIGAAGFFVWSLVVLLHQNLYGTRRFLEHFSGTDRLPSRQIQQISAACVLLFLLISGAVMFTAALFFPQFCAFLTALLAKRSGTFDLSDEPLFFAEQSPEQPDLSALAEDAAVTPAWVTLVNRLLEILAVLFLAAICFFILVQISRRLWHFLTRPRDWDDDERISLRPALFQKKEADARKTRRRLRLPASMSEQERIRRLYRKQITAGYKKQGLKEPPAGWMSPEELEITAHVQDEPLHSRYENARYGNQEKGSHF
ncbi:MAG: hypothetical protein LUC94_04675 [Clostridiales bacterium]|nr:hypothetical protein [Clostridiales bacterium]